MLKELFNSSGTVVYNYNLTLGRTEDKQLYLLPCSVAVKLV